MAILRYRPAAVRLIRVSLRWWDVLNVGWREDKGYLSLKQCKKNQRGSDVVSAGFTSWTAAFTSSTESPSTLIHPSLSPSVSSLREKSDLRIWLHSKMKAVCVGQVLTQAQGCLARWWLLFVTEQQHTQCEKAPDWKYLSERERESVCVCVCVCLSPACLCCLQLCQLRLYYMDKMPRFWLYCYILWLCLNILRLSVLNDQPQLTIINVFLFFPPI